MDGGTGGQGMQTAGFTREDLNAELLKTLLQPLVKEIRKLRVDFNTDLCFQLESVLKQSGGNLHAKKEKQADATIAPDPLRRNAFPEPALEAPVTMTTFVRSYSEDNTRIPSKAPSAFCINGGTTPTATGRTRKVACQKTSQYRAKHPGEVEEEMRLGDIVFIDEGRKIASSVEAVTEAWVIDADTGAITQSVNEAAEERTQSPPTRGGRETFIPPGRGTRRLSTASTGASTRGSTGGQKRSYKDKNAFVHVHASEFQTNEEEIPQSRAHAIVSHDYFDYVMGVVLCCNAITIGIQVDVMARQNTSATPVIFQVFDILFCLLFVVELALRLCAFGWNFWVQSGWKWNLFDVFIVGFSVADELSKLLLVGTEMQTVIDSLGVLRMLRLGRIIRLVRMVRLIPALKSMVYLIFASMSSFFWTGVLLMILMYCVAVYFTEAATDVWHQHKHDDDAEMQEVLTAIRSHWGSIGQAVMSLFQAITGGEDWHNFVLVFRGVSDEAYTLNMVIFSLYIAFATLVMLNLVTGVFVEGAAKIAREEKESELVKHVKKLVKTIDTSGDGEISWEEFEDSLESRIMLDFLKGFEMDANQARDIFYVLDQDKSGTITLDEFISASISLHAQPKLADTEVLRYYVTQSFQEVFSRLDDLTSKVMDGKSHEKPPKKEQTPQRVTQLDIDGPCPTSEMEV